MRNCNAPASFCCASGTNDSRTAPLVLPFVTGFNAFSNLRIGRSSLLVYSEDGLRRSGVACLVRAIVNGECNCNCNGRK